MEHPIWLYFLSYISTLVSGQTPIMYAVTACKCLSYCAVSHISCIDIHSGISVQVSIALMLRFMPEISTSLFLEWFCHESQSTL